MERFIRTKDGKIYEYQNFVDFIRNSFTADLAEETIEKTHFEIVKQADTIEELIEVGDFVKTIIGRTDTVTKIEKVRNFIHFWLTCGDFTIFQNLTELYTKQGNDYILVARKENGEWMVL